MLPKISELEFENVIEDNETDLPQQGKSFLFDFDKGDFVLRDGRLVEMYGVDVLKQWIHKAILTAKDRFKVYKDNIDYGVTIDDLIGANYPLDFIKKEIENE